MREVLFVLALGAAALLPAPSHCKDTGLIFVSNEKSNNLIILDPQTYQVVKDLKVSRRPRDMHFSPDHSRLYVACGDDDVIDVIDVAKLEVVGKRHPVRDVAQRVEFGSMPAPLLPPQGSVR